MIKIQHETLRGDLENIFELNLKVSMHIVYWIVDSCSTQKSSDSYFLFKKFVPKKVSSTKCMDYEWWISKTILLLFKLKWIIIDNLGGALQLLNINIQGITKPALILQLIFQNTTNLKSLY